MQTLSEGGQKSSPFEILRTLMSGIIMSTLLPFLTFFSINTRTFSRVDGVSRLIAMFIVDYLIEPFTEMFIIRDSHHL